MTTENNTTGVTTTFASFELPKPLTDALETMRYSTPTPIQAKAIPAVMSGKDLIGIAQTGTGKTAAFGIPMVKALFEDKHAQGVVLVPTRELAVQIYEVARQLTQNIRNMKAWVLVGGTSMYAQVKSLPKKPRLIIATPGRLMDHLNKRTFNLSDLKMVVLDEADRMLDIGFEPQIREIFKHIPKERQTLLFSATFPKTIERLTREYMKEPAKITIGKISEPAKEIDQSFVHTTVSQKNPLLIKELNERTGSVLIFVRTKHKVDRIAKMLMQEGFEVDRIHGARTQGQRNRVIQDFRTMKIRIMVATDVASRGLDIPHIEHVINYDIPEVPEDYVHRIGRTARAGKKGQSISFLTSEDKTKWMYLSRHLNALGVKTAVGVKPVSIMDQPTPMKPETEKVDMKETKEPIIEYKKPRDYAKKTSRYNRSQSHFSRQKSERSDRAPRGEGRSFNRSDRAPRGEGRPFHKGKADGRPFQKREGGERSFAPRGEGRSFNRSDRAPRGEGRGFNREGGERNFNRGERSFNRSDRAPRGEGRSFGNRDSRGPKRSYAPKGGPRPSRPQPPREGGERNFNRGERSFNRSDRAPRGEGRSFGNRDSRGPRGEGRPFQKREGGERNFNRGERSFNRSDRAPRGEGRSFGNRDSRPSGDRRPRDREGRPYGGSNSKPFPRDSKPQQRPFNRDR